MTLDRLPHDRQLAKRLDRDARAAARVRQRAELAYAKAVRRRERKQAKARAALPSQVVVAVVAGVVARGFEGLDVLAYPAALCAGVGALRSVRVLRRPAPVPPVVVPLVTVPPPPDPRSAAWPAVRRLEVVRDELRRLLPLVSPAGREVAHEAWHAAAEADTALRWQAARLAAVEPHRGADPELLRPLLDGVACQEALLGAVADLVVASADPLAGTRLRDATDAVSGLAQGLREVR